MNTETAGHRRRLRPRARLIGLLVCALAGTAVGLLGRHFGGGDAWFLALPLAIAVGWLFVADPLQCQRPQTPPAADLRPEDR